jgi:hypothetical protein
MIGFETKSSPRGLTETMASNLEGNHPILLSIRDARRHFGSLGTTAFYSAVKRYDIKLVKLGGRSLVPMAEVERVVALLIAERPTESSQKARVLAAQSVAARRRKRGSAAP